MCVIVFVSATIFNVQISLLFVNPIVHLNKPAKDFLFYQEISANHRTYMYLMPRVLS